MTLTRFQITESSLISPLLSHQEDSPPSDHTKWREWVKSKWRAFNSGLEAVYTAQSGWTIPDAKLRASVRLAAQQVNLAMGL